MFGRLRSAPFHSSGAPAVPDTKGFPKLSDEIFREVEEEVRRERLEKIWKEYGDYIVAAVSVLLLAIAGYRLWSVYQAREAMRASEQFIAAQQLLDSGQSQTAAQQFARLAQTAPGGYAKLSALQEADALAASGNTAAALNSYRKLIDSGDDMLSSIARVRTAWLTVDGAPKSQVESTLGGLADQASPWRPVAMEILAYADFHAGNTKQALSEFRALSKDSKASAGVRGRSEAMATFIEAGGAQNYGKPLYPELPGTLVPGVKGAVTGTHPAQQAPANNSQGPASNGTTKGSSAK